MIGSEIDPEVRTRALDEHRQPPVELLVYRLVEACERLFDARIAEINIDARDPLHIRCTTLLKPELQRIDISFSINL